LNTKVEVVFIGRYATQLNISSEYVCVHSDISQGCNDVQKHLENKYNILPPYMLLINGIHSISACRTNPDTLLKDGDVFKLIPYISGG